MRPVTAICVTVIVVAVLAAEAVVPGGDASAGSLPVPAPFGAILSTDITPHEETGTLGA